MMGSPKTEKERLDDEGSQHKVTIPRPFAIGRTQVTRGQFARFVKATNYRTTSQNYLGGCFKAFTSDGRQNVSGEGGSWRDPGFEQTDDHPVACIGWHDAQAYIQWLNSQLSTSAYRLPTEAEWEYAARAGSATRYHWGNDPALACKYANIADQTAGPQGISWGLSSECSDGYFLPPQWANSSRINLGCLILPAMWLSGPTIAGIPITLMHPRTARHGNRTTVEIAQSAWDVVQDGLATMHALRHAARGAVDGGNNGLGFRLAKTLP